jgi:hypothetical protein
VIKSVAFTDIMLCSLESQSTFWKHHYSSEIWIDFQWTVRYDIPEDSPISPVN